jgi:hypothetical protein
MLAVSLLSKEKRGEGISSSPPTISSQQNSTSCRV